MSPRLRILARVIQVLFAAALVCSILVPGFPRFQTVIGIATALMLLALVWACGREPRNPQR